MSAIVCPKCQYLRKKINEAPLWQCPSCKVAYNKVSLPAKSLLAPSIPIYIEAVVQPIA